MMGSRALRRVTVGASSLALAALVAIGGTSLPAVASSAPPNPALALAVAQWVTNGGETDLMTLAGDFDSLSTSADSGDMTAITGSCTRLQGDVETAQAYDPIPDPEAQHAWAAALTEYERGATDCVDGAGATMPNPDLITKASGEITAGSNDLNLVTSRLNQIAG
jgi:hypothetical protein